MRSYSLESSPNVLLKPDLALNVVPSDASFLVAGPALFTDHRDGRFDIGIALISIRDGIGEFLQRHFAEDHVGVFLLPHTQDETGLIEDIGGYRLFRHVISECIFFMNTDKTRFGRILRPE